MGKQKVAVVGGGLGALSGAIQLAKSGLEVVLFEKNATVGGKMSERVFDGFRFDTGPSLLTMPFVLDDLFRSAGFARSDFIELVATDPICRYFFPDGSRLDAGATPEGMREAIAEFAPDDADGFRRFMEYSRRIYEFSKDVFLFTPFGEFSKMKAAADWRMLFRIHHLDPLRTVHRAVSRHFRDPRLVQLFDRYTTYNGSNPFRAPATLNVIPYVEYAFGGWYVRGGMYRIAEALAEVARRLDVEIHTSLPVEKILHDGRRVNGVQIGSEKVAADFVLCGADVVDTWNHLIDGFPQRTAKLNRLEPSSSGMVFLWGVRDRHPQLAMHNILFSRDYRREFESLFDRLEPPDDPTVYIAITSRIDPDHAPEDGENWFVLLNMPHLADGQNWPEAVDRKRRAVLERLAQAGIGVSDAIAAEQVWTPEDFQRDYGSNRGSIYGISSNSRSAAFRRPPNRSRELEGLFFAGGSTHPGGGVPLVLLSGKMAAELIAEAADVDAISWSSVGNE